MSSSIIWGECLQTSSSKIWSDKLKKHIQVLSGVNIQYNHNQSIIWREYKKYP